jgi:hypothetical protein
MTQRRFTIEQAGSIPANEPDAYTKMLGYKAAYRARERAKRRARELAQYAHIRVDGRWVGVVVL